VPKVAQVPESSANVGFLRRGFLKPSFSTVRGYPAPLVSVLSIYHVPTPRSLNLVSLWRWWLVMGRMEIFEVRRLESFRYPLGDFPLATLLDWASWVLSFVVSLCT
jgi:hypothetical protein